MAAEAVTHRPADSPDGLQQQARTDGVFRLRLGLNLRGEGGVRPSAGT